MSTALGECIFQDIEKNEYLQEIFSAILYNYSLKLFNFPNNAQRVFSINDALRFADLLSKSTDPAKSEMHKVWAQEIVALLSTLYPDNESVKFYLGSVLSNTCNYRGFSLHPNNYRPVNAFESLYEEYKKSQLKIPYQANGYFFKSQKSVFDAFEQDRFSYSGPTSMGKSFVMRMFIKKQIASGKQENYAIVVPTKALINEVSIGVFPIPVLYIYPISETPITPLRKTCVSSVCPENLRRLKPAGVKSCTLNCLATNFSYWKIVIPIYSNTSSGKV